MSRRLTISAAIAVLAMSATALLAPTLATARLAPLGPAAQPSSRHPG